MQNQTSQHLHQVRTQSPLVHNITNYVVMNNTANALLAIGASPVMAHAREEVVDMVSIANSLVINMGTLSGHWVDAMIDASKKASELQKPIVFDPVGVGATAYRNKVACDIINEGKPNIIRGNASEIIALYNCYNETNGTKETATQTKGVDSNDTTDSALDSAKRLSLITNAVVVISGEVDYITDGKSEVRVHNGHSIMTKVTGMGCTASAIIGAFAAVEKDYLIASKAAMTVMGICGEIAAKTANGNGSMQINFLDTLYQLDEQMINATYREA